MKMEVMRDTLVDVGVYNPGFWGMNIEKGQKYSVIWYQRSSGVCNITVSFTGFNGSQVLASRTMSSPSRFLNWTRMEVVLVARESNPDSRIQFTTNRKGLTWFDQVSAMPLDTYKGHGFRKDLFEMIAELKPGFLRLPGGMSVEGKKLHNAFKWKNTVGPWEERPGHFGDIWNYWTDDGLGLFELLLLAEDLSAEPIMVVNCGISLLEHVDTSDVEPYVQDMLDGIEFARGEATSAWGSVRARMGHPQPFQLKYVTIGNKNCGSPFYKGGNYLELYKALKQAYPDIQAISNCLDSTNASSNPANLREFEKYFIAPDMFFERHVYDSFPRDGAKFFASGHVVMADGGRGNLFVALAEATFLIGVELDSDTVEMASSLPLLANVNDQMWRSGTIRLNSSAAYGTPTYWMQRVFFRHSNGATLIPSDIDGGEPLFASAISWLGDDHKKYTSIKVVNYGDSTLELSISFQVHKKTRAMVGLSRVVLTSSNTANENSFQNPKMVYPVTGPFNGRGKVFNVSLSPYSLQLFDFSEENEIEIIRREFKHLMEHLKDLAYIIINLSIVAFGICRLCRSTWGSSSNIQVELEMTDLA